MTETSERQCPICHLPMIYFRRVTRSTYRCAHTEDRRHVAARAADRRARADAEMIANLSPGAPR